MQWLKRVVGSEKVLFFPGCIIQGIYPRLLQNYLTILEDIGVDAIMLPEFKCCGGIPRNAGYEKEFNDLLEHNTKLFKRFKISKIITPDPNCAYTFYHEYDIDVEHVSVTLAKHKRKLSSSFNQKAHYHESGILKRKLGISKQVKSLITSSGIQLVSAPEKSCGSCAGDFSRNFPKIAQSMANSYLNGCTENTIITSCPHCYHHLNQHKGEEFKILELSELFAEVL